VVRGWAALILGQVGDKAVSALIPALAHPSAKGRAAAAEAVAHVGPAALPAVAALGALLCDEDDDVQTWAGRALGEIGRDTSAAGDAVPALLELLRTESQRTLQRFLAEALGQIGPTAVQALFEALPRSTSEERLRIVQALGVIGPQAAAAVPTLVASLTDSDVLVRREAAWALARIPPTDTDAPAAVAGLVAMLSDPLP